MKETKSQRPDSVARIEERFRPGTYRIVSLTTTDMDRPITVLVKLDVALPADQVMYTLWAATGVAPSASALLSRYEQSAKPSYFGVEAVWENSANREAVESLDNIQFGQLFLPDCEVYAEIDPARGWRARVRIEPEAALGLEAEDEHWSTVRISQEPFGIPTALTKVETDVLLKASDGESLTPLQQQILVQLDEPIDLPIQQVSQVMALTTLHGVRLGIPPEFVDLIPWVMVELPYALPARELFRFIHASDDGVTVTKTGRISVSELRRLLRATAIDPDVFGIADQSALAELRLSDVPLLDTAWNLLQDTGLITIDAQRAHLAAELAWLDTVTKEELDSYFEAVLLGHVRDQGLLDTAGSQDTALHPTLEYESAQEYADSLISSAMAEPGETIQHLMDDRLFDFADPEEQREHIEFAIELLDMSEPVTRRMSVPSDANLHASIETILVMFGWKLTHLWQLDLLDSVGLRQTAAVAYRDTHLEVPLAAELVVGNVLHPDGSQYVLTYDFGDGWEMLITPLGTRTAGAGGELLTAEGVCPPEDSGGPAGYETKLLAMRDPVEFQRQYPDYESEEIRELANWARTHSSDHHVPEPDFYALEEHALPYDF